MARRLVDADQVAREVVEPGGPAYQPLIDRFGTAILDEGGRIDRPSLAAIAFGDPKALADLNAITHPAIGVEMLARPRPVRRAGDGGGHGHPAAAGRAPRPALAGRRGRGRRPARGCAAADWSNSGGWTRRTPGPAWPPSPTGPRVCEGADFVVDNSGDTPSSGPRSTGSGLAWPSWPPAMAPRRRPAAEGQRVAAHPTITLAAWPDSRCLRRSSRPATSPRPSPRWWPASNEGTRYQTLLGITGSGKTATIAWTIEAVQRPTLIIEPNKSLAAQLAAELKEFFPRNRVEYFVSYYDYYQPEAYVPSSDTYIEKDSSINDEIDRLRHATTSSLLMRPDTIVVASVSCIYGLGSPDEYRDRDRHPQPGRDPRPAGPAAATGRLAVQPQ